MKRTYVPRYLNTVNNIIIKRDIPVGKKSEQRSSLQNLKPKNILTLGYNLGKTICIDPYAHQNWKEIEDTLRHEYAHNIEGNLGNFDIHIKKGFRSNQDLTHTSRFWYVAKQVGVKEQNPDFPKRTYEKKKYEYLNKIKPTWNELKKPKKIFEDFD